PRQYSALGAGEAALQLEEFKAALIEISGEAFARNFSSSPSGRGMLQRLLEKDSILNRNQRIELIQGIYHAGDDKNVQSLLDWEGILDVRSPFHGAKMAQAGYVNLWVKNYFKLWTDEEVAAGQEG